jgi:hypothetical protein
MHIVLEWICAHPWWTFIIFACWWVHLFWGASTADLSKSLYIALWVVLTDLNGEGRLRRLQLLARRRGVTEGELLDAMLDKYEPIIDEVEFPSKQRRPTLPHKTE